MEHPRFVNAHSNEEDDSGLVDSGSDAVFDYAHVYSIHNIYYVYM